MTANVVPALNDGVVPPVILGTADLTHFAYQGHDHAALLDRIDRLNGCEIGRCYDKAVALQLGFQRAAGLDLMDTVLARSPLFRLAHAADAGLRLLAVVTCGDLMTNMPVDFLTNHLNVRLDLLYVVPGEALPAQIPDHDIALFAAGEADADTLSRLVQLYAAWPRPALNDPALLPRLERDELPRTLAGIPGLCSPAAVAVTRDRLEEHLRHGTPIPGFGGPRGMYPCLIRPYASHAGSGLSRLADPTELTAYLRLSFGRDFILTQFADYAGPDGLYRKLRVAFIDGMPFLCHLAVSSHWMVHYLNAGMTESAAKRAEEAEAMAAFENGFARRHATALDALVGRLGFDCFSIDCAEMPDGRLLVFEADTAAIIHMMDPPDLFPYKPPQMRRVFAAFETMLRRRVAQSATAKRVAGRRAAVRRAAIWGAEGGEPVHADAACVT
jgi:hypothetical protein